MVAQTGWYPSATGLIADGRPPERSIDEYVRNRNAPQNPQRLPSATTCRNDLMPPGGRTMRGLQFAALPAADSRLLKPLQNPHGWRSAPDDTQVRQFPIACLRGLLSARYGDASAA